MELCSSTISIKRFTKFTTPSLSLFSTTTTSSISFSTSKQNSLSHKLSSSSSHYKSRRRFEALAASASPPKAASADQDQLPAELHVTETLEPNSRIRLSVQVPQVVCDDCYRRVLREISKEAKVPGFRPGKVPESILISVAGQKNVQKATVESILNRTLPHAMAAVTDRALRDSVRIDSSFSDMEKAYSSNNTLRYDVVADMVPEVKWIADGGYKNLKINVEIDSDIDARKASEEEFKRRHKSLGVLKIVTDRGLQIGDVAVLDISATTVDEDESNVQTIPSAESKGFNFDTEYGDRLIPGFLDSIVGIKIGETKSFQLAFPESWTQENLRGIHAQFTVECKELFYRDLPELDDSLAGKLLPECTTLEQVKESLLQKFQEAEQNARDQATDNAILDQLQKMIEVDIPQSLFEEQGRELYGARLLQLQTEFRLNEQQLATLSSPKAVNEFMENQKENITKLIKQNLAVGDIFRQEKLQFSTEELVGEVQKSIAEFKRHKQEYDEERVKEQVQDVLEGAKVLEWLRERAEIEYITK